MTKPELEKALEAAEAKIAELEQSGSAASAGSATRWNSLTPLFMRQGSVQPLRVTTGL